MSNTGLGRGLGSLIPDKQSDQTNDDLDHPGQSNTFGQSNHGNILEVNISKIKENPMQPRRHFEDHSIDELAESIKKHGIIQPLIVTKKGTGFELIAGERRLRAAKLSGLDQVPVVVRTADEQEKLELALIENIQREDLSPIDLARAYKQLVDEFNMSQDEVAKQVGKSRPVVTNTIRYLGLPDEIQNALISGQITEGHAKIIVGLDTEEKMFNIFRKVIRNNLTITDVQKEARRIGGTKAARIKINYADKDKEFALREFFGTKVEIRRKGKGGQIIIDYFSDEELDEIVDKVK